MVEKVLWPAYFDAALSRSEGRRASLDIAIEEPEVGEIAEAVSQVGYDATVERDPAYPRAGWVERGRVLVTNADDATKSDLIAAVAAYIAAMRE